MKRKILIEKTEGQIRTFFLEDGDIVEIHCADTDGDRAGSHRLGDIYIGKVKNIVLEVAKIKMLVLIYVNIVGKNLKGIIKLNIAQINV